MRKDNSQGEEGRPRQGQLLLEQEAGGDHGHERVEEVGAVQSTGEQQYEDTDEGVSPKHDVGSGVPLPPAQGSNDL